jgi:hypothetical protein
MKTTFKLATLFTESISDSKLGDLDTESIQIVVSYLTNANSEE